MKLLWLGMAVVAVALPAPAAEEAPSAEEAQMPSTHREAAERLIALLLQTDECLAGCTDAASVQAALPTLRQLAEKVHAFKKMQDELPEPTVQDYMAAQDLAASFNRAWTSIRANIERLKKAGLLTPELQNILSGSDEMGPGRKEGRTGCRAGRGEEERP